MSQTPEELIKQAEKYFENKEYGEIIYLLPDEYLAEQNNAILYTWRARAHQKLNEIDLALHFVEKALSVNPSLPFALFVKGNIAINRKNYSNAIEYYDTAISNDKAYAEAYYNRGYAWNTLEEYEKAIEDYTSAINLDPTLVTAYENRGTVWASINDVQKAIEDYNTAISLNKNKASAYYNRGTIWLNEKEYDKAIEDYNTAISLDKNYASAYNNRGSAWAGKMDYEKAIKDYNDYIQLINDPKNYYSQLAQARTKELEKEIAKEWYRKLVRLIQKIRDLLLFSEKCITHYTSLSASKAMLLDNSKFRISEGAFLNDTSEGRTLFEFLKYDTFTITQDKTIAEPFAEKSFIGSFVAETKHDDLTLWRMYGKDNQIEAKGCALTLHKNDFIAAIQQQINESNSDTHQSISSKEDFQFYSVAYINKVVGVFVIPGNEQKAQELNEVMQQLKESVQQLDSNQKKEIAELLNSIAYLFKSTDYQYEQEVRLIVRGIGFNKTIDKSTTPPRVYIELVDIVPAITKITLGPKVDRADEWAAAFNYYIKQEYKEIKPKIVISHLPFK